MLTEAHQLWRSSRFSGLEPGETFTLADAAKSFCLRNSGKGILVLITDLMDKSGYEAALRYLLAQDFDIYLIHLLSAEEYEPEVQGDLRLIDCEDGDVAEVTVTAPLLKRYKQTLHAFIEAARDFCSRRDPVFSSAERLPVER